jgi:hypothetical protein
VSCFLISPSSRRRPTKLVTSAGKFPERWAGLAIVDSTLQGHGRQGRLRIGSSILSIRASGGRLRLTTMTEQLPNQRVEVLFVGTPPSRQIARASGVSDVEVNGHRLRCSVCGSFQPFLEALRGYEVIGLTSTPVPEGGG